MLDFFWLFYIIEHNFYDYYLCFYAVKVKTSMSFVWSVQCIFSQVLIWHSKLRSLGFQPHLNRKRTGFGEMYSLYWWIVLASITGRRSIFVFSRRSLNLTMVNQQFSFLDKGEFGMHYYLMSIWCIFDIYLTGHTSGFIPMSLPHSDLPWWQWCDHIYSSGAVPEQNLSK